MSDTTKSIDELREEMAGILYSDKSVMTSELNKLLNLVATKLQEAEIRARLEEVTYWHKRTIREAPHPSQIASTLHEQEARIATLTQDTKGGTDERY